MTDTEDPIDEARTTRSRAGMVWRDRRQLFGLALLLVAVLLLVAAMNAGALREAGWAVGLGIGAIALGAGGVAEILTARRRAVDHARHRQTPE